MKYLYSIFEKLIGKLSLKEDKYLYDSSYEIDYEIYVGDEYIGMCNVEAILKEDDFDDKTDEYVYDKNIKFDYTNPVKIEDYENNRYIIYFSDFEIEEEFRGNGYGISSMKLIIESISKNFPNNDGIYLSVSKKNKIAIKIYESLGFIIVKDEDISTLEMKLKL